MKDRISIGGKCKSLGLVVPGQGERAEGARKLWWSGQDGERRQG